MEGRNKMKRKRPFSKEGAGAMIFLLSRPAEESIDYLTPGVAVE